MNGEHFIPFRKADVVAMCADELPAGRAGIVPRLHPDAGEPAAPPLPRAHRGAQGRLPSVQPGGRHPDHARAEPGRPARRRSSGSRRSWPALARAANFTQIDLAELDRASGEHRLLKVRLAVDLDADRQDHVLPPRRDPPGPARCRPGSGCAGRRSTFTNYARVLVYAKFKDAEHSRAPTSTGCRSGPDRRSSSSSRTCPATTWRWSSPTCRCACAASTSC